MFIKRRIIQLLIRLLESKITYRDIDEERINNWLADTSQDMRFQQYFKKRDLTILKSLGIGLERDDYLVKIGQRLELLQLLSAVDGAKKAKERETALKQREAERKKREQEAANQPK